MRCPPFVIKRDTWEEETSCGGKAEMAMKKKELMDISKVKTDEERRKRRRRETKVIN